MSFLQAWEIYLCGGAGWWGTSCWAVPTLTAVDESPSGYSLRGLSGSAQFRFTSRAQNAIQWYCRSRILQRTANRVLTVCLNQGGNPIWDLFASMIDTLTAHSGSCDRSWESEHDD